VNALIEHELDDLPEEQERERFRIETVDQVNWALRKLSAIEAKRKEVEELAQAEIDRIQVWKEHELKKLQDNAEFFGNLLHDYALRQRAADPNWKRTSTPYGVVRLRKQPPKWIYDDAKLLESLKSQGLTHFIRVKEEPDKAAIKKAEGMQYINGKLVDLESGAIIEGVVIEEQPEKVEIDL